MEWYVVESVVVDALCAAVDALCAAVDAFCALFLIGALHDALDTAQVVAQCHKYLRRDLLPLRPIRQFA